MSETYIQLGERDFSQQYSDLEEGESSMAYAGDEVHDGAIHFANVVGPVVVEREVGAEISDRGIGLGKG